MPETVARSPRGPDQSGLTLIETMVVVAVMGVVVAAVTAFAYPALGRERARSAVYDFQSFVQLTRLEAIKRNRDCRLVVDGSSRMLEIWDGRRTSTTSDDELIRQRRLHSSLEFVAPDGGTAVSLESLGSERFQTVFTSQGSVASGAGSVSLHGGDSFERVSILGAGATRVERWNGSEWISGWH